MRVVNCRHPIISDFRKVASVHRIFDRQAIPTTRLVYGRRSGNVLAIFPFENTFWILCDDERDGN